MHETSCDLCSSSDEASGYDVTAELNATVCTVCRAQISGAAPMNANHWRALQESIWSDSPAVKVLAWRMLTRLSSEGWAQDLLQQLDLEEDLREIAEEKSAAAGPQTRDSNGTPLLPGDSVTLIKDLEVKGAGFTAKRGTLVKNIVLTDDPGLIEGRVNGTQIVLKTIFLKKQS